jgi:hypothetical protein
MGLNPSRSPVSGPHAKDTGGGQALYLPAEIDTGGVPGAAGDTGGGGPAPYLPAEIWLQISEHLRSTELCAVACTCEELRRTV